jgi:hypothetical protein
MIPKVQHMGFNGFSRGYQKRAWSFNMTDDFKLALADIMTYCRYDVRLVLVLPFQHCVVFHIQQALQPCLIKFALSNLIYCFYYRVEAVVNITIYNTLVSLVVSFYINMRSICEACRAWGSTFSEYISDCDQISVCEMTTAGKLLLMSVCIYARKRAKESKVTYYIERLSAKSSLFQPLFFAINL